MKTKDLIKEGQKIVKDFNPKLKVHNIDIDLKENSGILFISLNPSDAKDKPESWHRNYNKESHFKMLDNFIEESKWEHIDLFFIKNKTSADIKKLIFEGSKEDKLTKFGRDQLDISLHIIEELTPKIIVVINALASKILKKEFGLEKLNEKGYYLWRNTPVFFSGMLSGGRSLDVGSRERLIWHIKKVLDDGL